MRHIFFYLFTVLLLSSLLQKKASGQSHKPTKLIFENYFISDRQDTLKHLSFLDSLYDPQGIDSLENRSLKEMTFSDLWSGTPATKLIIQVDKDSIWYHKTENGKMIGDYRMILRQDKKFVHYYDKSKRINFQKSEIGLYRNDYDVTITAYKNDRKNIHGFDCFKLKIVRSNKENALETTSYEMYVTDKIDLPAHLIVFGIDLQPGLFPLEVFSREFFLPSVAEVYRLIEIE